MATLFEGIHETVTGGFSGGGGGGGGGGANIAELW